MFTDFLASRDLLQLPIFALGIFLTTFLLVLAYVLIGWRRTEATDRLVRLPLEDELNADPTVPRLSADDEKEAVRAQALPNRTEEVRP